MSDWFAILDIVSDNKFLGWKLRYPIHEKHSTIFYFQIIFLDNKRETYLSLCDFNS